MNGLGYGGLLRLARLVYHLIMVRSKPRSAQYKTPLSIGVPRLKKLTVCQVADWIDRHIKKYLTVLLTFMALLYQDINNLQKHH